MFGFEQTHLDNVSRFGVATKAFIKVVISSSVGGRFWESFSVAYSMHSVKDLSGPVLQLCRLPASLEFNRSIKRKGDL